MLKLPYRRRSVNTGSQPPLGGCVLKQIMLYGLPYNSTQPPLGGCVLKPSIPQELNSNSYQPPLGGCVLKHKARVRGNGFN